MKKIIKRLLGSDTPQPGHWLEPLREAPAQLPATTEPNTSGLERMLNQPIDRRTFMERTGQAAQAASTMNRLGGALEGLVPRAVEATPPAPVGIDVTDYFKSLMDNLSPRKKELLEEEFDMRPEDFVDDYGLNSKLLANLRIKSVDDPKAAMDEVIDHAMEQLGSAKGRLDLPIDQQMRQAELAEEADMLFNILDGLRFKGKKHKQLPDLFDYFNTMVEPPPLKTQAERDEYFRRMDESMGNPDPNWDPDDH